MASGSLAHLIVGIDSGKTAAIACLSLDGKLVGIMHMVSGGIPWILESIRVIGTPSIIATDRKIPGDTVRKINAAFNARLYLPPSDISIMEKRELARKTGIKDVHERDAYAAAVRAYHAHANKLNQAEHISRERKVQDIDRIKARIIQRYSISEAILGRKANRP